MGKTTIRYTVLLILFIRYYLQGNDDFNCEAAVRARNALKRYPKVSQALKNFWAVFKKDDKMRISKQEYIDVMVKIAKVLTPQFDEYQARAAVEVFFI